MHRLLILLFICFAGTASAQLSWKNQFGEHFKMNDTHIVLLNEFMLNNDGREYTPEYLKRRNDTLHYTFYGPDIRLSILELDTATWYKKTHSGAFTYDSFPANQWLYRLATLQISVARDSTAPDNWRYVRTLPIARDTNIYHKQDTTEQGTYHYVPLAGFPIGGTLKIGFRKDDGTQLMTIILKRDSIPRRALMMTAMFDSTQITELQFIQKALEFKKRMPEMSRLYRYWPTPGLQYNNFQITSSFRLAFYFRLPEDTNDSSFQYRLNHGEWIKSDGAILITSLQKGASYKLEVRLREHPDRVSVYTFFVPGEWYQTTWFKVSLAVLSAIMALLFIFWYNIRKARRKSEKRRLQLQTLYAQLNPHFVFNALSSIQGLMNDRQLEKANRYLSGFSVLLRHSMEAGNREQIPLQQELRDLRNYLQLEALRFSFRHHTQIDAKLDTAALEVPPMLAQPLVENAVKHGISGMGEAGVVELLVEADGEDVVISVRDNGKGFDPAQRLSGQGLQLTKDRIGLYNKLHRHQHIHLQIDSGQSGTTATLRFKNWLTA